MYDLAYAHAEPADVLERSGDPYHAEVRSASVAAFRAMGMPDLPRDLGPLR